MAFELTNCMWLCYKTVFVDWNKYLVSDIRSHINYFRPCYYMAFNPYRQDGIARDTCDVNYAASDQQPANPAGNTYTRNLLPCDAYFAIVLYVTSASIFTLIILFYFYTFYSFLKHAVDEFRGSRWVDILDKLVKIRDEELEDYQVI